MKRKGLPFWDLFHKEENMLFRTRFAEAEKLGLALGGERFVLV